MGLPSSFTNECFSKCNINKSEGTAQGNQRNAPCFHSSLTAYNIHHRFRHTKPLLIEYHIPSTENPINQTLLCWKLKKIFEEKTLRKKPSRILCRKSNNNLIRNKFKLWNFVSSMVNSYFPKHQH